MQNVDRLPIQHFYRPGSFRNMGASIGAGRGRLVPIKVGQDCPRSITGQDGKAPGWGAFPGNVLTKGNQPIFSLTKVKALIL